jgi:hypothetical protein
LTFPLDKQEIEHAIYFCVEGTWYVEGVVDPSLSSSHRAVELFLADLP